MKTTILAALLLVTAHEVAPAATNYDFRDGARIRISGEVREAAERSFVLAYFSGSITVEVDDYDSYQEGLNLINGDQVVVDGIVDADPGTIATIEAGMVYIPREDVRVYASAADEEDIDSRVRTSIASGTEVDLFGRIVAVGENELILQTSLGQLSVKVGNAGMSELRTGGLITVRGDFQNRIFAKDEVFAKSIRLGNGADASR